MTILTLSNDGLDDVTRERYATYITDDSENELETINPYSRHPSISERFRRNSTRHRRVKHKIGTEGFQHLAEALRNNMVDMIHYLLLQALHLFFFTDYYQPSYRTY